MKSKVWKYATIVVVLFLIFNPEMVGLALFIDAVGLDLFIMLLEVQVFAILGALLNIKIKPIITCVKYFYARHIQVFSWEHIKEEPENLMLVVPSSATLMCTLVCSVAISIALNAH